MGRPDFESKWKCKMKKEVSLLLCFLHCCPFIQLFLLSASLAALIIADRTFSLLVSAPTARVCVKQAGTNHIGLFKPGWSASNCAIGPLAAACGHRDMDPIGHRHGTRPCSCCSPNPLTGNWPRTCGAPASGYENASDSATACMCRPGFLRF